ncbi:hypothetical protein OPV22_027018 [Ensete ventricosum]|uniref:Uncharacterized protein n=1 Tax=Ensete ventricosum TaxID=4639 RepID=A0AAV8Q4M1_ENSVE|nr:hypothetical protein OPV22_027018 [Ensete ventricosum]
METATTDLASDDSVTANAAWAGPPVLCPSDHFFCGTSPSLGLVSFAANSSTLRTHTMSSLRVLLLPEVL